MTCSDGLNKAVAGATAARVLHEDDRAVVMDLMRASERVLAPLIEKEADIYTVEDLKIRFRRE
jgi:hypothetical protein